VIFRQFHAKDGQLSYLFADSITRNAAVLDPHLILERYYIDLIVHLDLKLKFVIETHTHESHFSAAPLLCEATGAQWIMSHLVAGTVQAQAVKHGEYVFMGEEYFSVLETPGHSTCSMCYRWRDRVFTGHTLLVDRAGDCGRPDADALKLHESIMQRLYVLPEDTIVFPGVETDGCWESTIGFERKHNREVSMRTSLDEFATLKRSTGVIPRGAATHADVRFPATDLYPFGKDSLR
jgi:sulfur dioxygenase